MMFTNLKEHYLVICRYKAVEDKGMKHWKAVKKKSWKTLSEQSVCASCYILGSYANSSKHLSGKPRLMVNILKHS